MNEVHIRRDNAVDYYNDHLQENHHGYKFAATIKNVLYGALDGIVSTFNIIAAAVASGLPPNKIIILSLANLISDGLSMGLGDFISSYGQQKYIKSEYRKEMFELENNEEYEKNELIQFFQEKNMTAGDATIIVNILIKYPDIFLENMIKYELELDMPEPTIDILKGAVVTFFSFCIFGSIPILSFFASKNFLITSISTGGALILIGCVEAAITKQNMLTAGVSTLINGTIAVITAYFISFYLEGLAA